MLELGQLALPAQQPPVRRTVDRLLPPTLPRHLSPMPWPLHSHLGHAGAHAPSRMAVGNERRARPSTPSESRVRLGFAQPPRRNPRPSPCLLPAHYPLEVPP